MLGTVVAIQRVAVTGHVCHFMAASTTRVMHRTGNHRSGPRPPREPGHEKSDEYVDGEKAAHCR